MSQRALILIDLQNDYFPAGLFPLWEPEAVLDRSLAAVALARAQGIPVILVQHVADTAQGPAPFFNPGSTGVALHERVLAAAPQAPVIVKQHADSFHHTDLAATLARLGVSELLLAGMMTHNCVTHTALSKAAEPYRVTVLTDASTTVSKILHLIALKALSTRVALSTVDEALAGAQAG